MVQRNKLIGINSSKIIDFSVNYGPFRFPRKFLKDIKINGETIANYPKPNSEETTSLLAKYLGIEKENTLISNGSSELFFLIPKIFKFKKTVLLEPTFWEYGEALRRNNLKVDSFILESKDNFKFDRDKFIRAIQNADCAYICNPNNPTSTLIERDILISLISQFKDKIFVVDETYLLFLKNYNKLTLNDLSTKVNNLIVISSLSKIFSIGGIRLGFCVSSRKNISLIKKNMNPYPIRSVCCVMM